VRDVLEVQKIKEKKSFPSQTKQFFFWFLLISANSHQAMKIWSSRQKARLPKWNQSSNISLVIHDGGSFGTACKVYKLYARKKYFIPCPT